MGVGSGFASALTTTSSVVRLTVSSLPVHVKLSPKTGRQIFEEAEAANWAGFDIDESSDLDEEEQRETDDETQRLRPAPVPNSHEDGVKVTPEPRKEIEAG